MVTITRNTVASTTLLCLLLVNVLSLCQPRSIKGICQKGWKYYETENVCIYYTLARKPGKSAGEVCRSRGAKLVNITTDHKKAFVVLNRPSTKYENWIDSYYEDPKEWSPFNLLTGDSQGQCVKVKADSEKLIRGSCDSYHRFVCEKQQGKNATCPHGWKLYSDAGKSVCLIGVYTVKNCQGATAHCKNLNAVLAMPKTENKFDAILGARPNKNWPMFVGIKMTSKTAKAAAFADGTKLKSCRVIEHDAKGISGYMDCNLSRRIICEKARASGPYQHK